MNTHFFTAFCALLALGLTIALPMPSALAKDIQINNAPVWVTPLPIPAQIQYPASEIQYGTHYLILDVQARVRPNPPVEMYQHYALHIVNQTGVTENSQINLNYDPSYQTIQLHTLRIIRSGKSIDKINTAQMKVLQREEELESLIHNGEHTLNIILDDVRVGDTIEYSFSRIGSNPVYQGLFAFEHNLSWSIPIGALQLRMLWEKPKPLYHKITHSALKLQQTKTAAGIEYRITDNNIAPVSQEDGVPAWHFPWGQVSFSELESWEQAVQWGLSLYKDAWQSNQELDHIAADILRTSDSDTQKIGKALRFVQDEVRYLGIELGENSHRPSPAYKTLTRRYGDCKDKTALLITLLKKLSINAYPALVNTELGDHLSEQLPSIGAFDHVITRVEHKGQAWWLDPTRTYQFGSVDSIHQPDYGQALVLKGGNAELQAMDPINRVYGINITDDFILDPNTKNPVSFTSTSEYLGWNAEQQRDRIASVGQKKLQKQYLEFYQNYYPDIHASSDLAFDDNEQLNQLKVSEAYEIPNFWHDNTKTQRFTSDFYPNGLSTYLEVPDEPSRKDPLRLIHPHRLEQTINIAFATDDWHFDNDAFKEENPFFTFRYKAIFTPPAKQLTLYYHYQTHTDYVPAANYKEYREALQRVRKHMGYGIYQNYPSSVSSDSVATENELSWWQTLDAVTIIVSYFTAYLAVFLLWRLDRWRHPYTGQSLFYPVHMGKLVAMWVFTLGLYPVYWFYRNFKYIRQELHGSIMPVPRAIFYSLWYFSLWQHLKKDNDARFEEPHLPNKAIAIVLAIIFIGTTLLMNETRLWGIGILISALICLPLANYIQFINRDNPDAQRYNSRWRLHNSLLVIISLPILLFAQSSELGFFPNSAVITGDRLLQSDVKRLQRAGVIKPGDNIQYFYSDGLFSVMEDGNGITQRHVFSYWQEEDGTISSQVATFDEVENIEVTRGSYTENTVINVRRKDGSEFLLYLSTEKFGDQRFINMLRSGLEKANMGI